MQHHAAVHLNHTSHSCAQLWGMNAGDAESTCEHSICTTACTVQSQADQCKPYDSAGAAGGLAGHKGAPGLLHAGMVPGLKDRHRAAQQRDGVAGDPKACIKCHILPGPAGRVRGACTAAGVLLTGTVTIPTLFE